MKTILKIALVVMISFALTIGCVSNQVKYSGFLNDYPEFKEGKKGGVDLVYLKEGVDFKSYNKVMMDHVVFYFSDESKYKGIHPDELKELSDTFHKVVVEALGGAYPLVDKPGTDVMRLRTAVTDVVANNPGMGAISTVMPIGLALSTIKKGITGTHTGVGQASIEVEILDSMTNERIAAAIDTKPGRKIEGFTKWGAVEGAFKFWAKRLRTWLDETQDRK